MKYNCQVILLALCAMAAAVFGADASDYTALYGNQYAQPKLDSYVWIVVVGALMSFFTAYGIGANDVANAFATSVGSGAITITQAILIAAVFEFLGAFLLGSQVTDTVRKKIADFDEFLDFPEVFMYGMLCVLTSVGIWLLIASYAELPVSTTHSTIGGVVGFALCVSPKAVVWSAPSDDFPYFKGISAVVASWFISPVLSGIIATFLFFMVRALVLRHSDSFNRAFWFFPPLVGLTLFINIFFILTKGAKSLDAIKNMDIGVKVGISAAIGVALGALVGVVAIFGGYKKAIANQFDENGQKIFKTKAKIDPEADQNSNSVFSKAYGLVQKATAHDVHSVINEDQEVSNIHENMEKFDPRTEEAFKYLQVFTAICDSFSHGANDVANSIGPFSGIWAVYQTSRLSKKSEVPKWILAFGGIGIVVGLATYGYNIMRAIGVKLMSLTPSRGFAVELGAALVIAGGSYFGLPLSTTHCQVGAEIGVGALEGKGGVNWPMFGKIFFGWVITLLVVGLFTAAIFSFGAYGPSVQQSRQIVMWRDWAEDFTQGARALALVRELVPADVQLTAGARVYETFDDVAVVNEPALQNAIDNGQQGDFHNAIGQGELFDSNAQLLAEKLETGDQDVKQVNYTAKSMAAEVELLTNTNLGRQGTTFKDWSPLLETSKNILETALKVDAGTLSGCDVEQTTEFVFDGDDCPCKGKSFTKQEEERKKAKCDADEDKNCTLMEHTHNFTCQVNKFIAEA